MGFAPVTDEGLPCGPVLGFEPKLCDSFGSQTTGRGCLKQICSELRVNKRRLLVQQKGFGLHHC